MQGALPDPRWPLVVCPSCHFGFPDKNLQGHTFTCPRAECGHRWNAETETIAAVHGARGRKACPELRVIAGAGPARAEVPEGETPLGRDPRCPILPDNRNVSRRHARIVREGDHVWIEDLGSASGTFVNGQAIGERGLLVPCDEILIGGVSIGYDVRFEADDANWEIADQASLIADAARTAPLGTAAGAAEVIPLTEERITFGRAEDRDVILPHAMIAHRHALIEYRDGGYYLSDTQSRASTFVNGRNIIRARLEPGDRVQLGPFVFRFEGARLRRLLELTSLGIVAVHLEQTAGAITLLDDISLAIRPGEFIGLLGPSGAGKSTLLDALNGLRPARSGQVLINGEPLYEQYERFRHHIGYVPQDDIIHPELTSREALAYAGRLRLPPDVTGDELQALVEETLSALDLTRRGDVPIRRLSGGQRKRVSVGVELLSKPGILFLDEPTSGLDPATESRLMRKLRQLADQGRTIVCTTHVMENVDLFDKVVVLAPGGRLAFFGPPLAAKAYFGTAKFTLLYDRLEERPPEEWKEQYRQSDLGRALLGTATGEIAVSNRRRQRLAPAPASSAFAQWRVLTSRFATILRSDKPNLALLAAQPLVIAGLICLVCREMPLIFFLLVVAALWFGCSTAAQQIVKERSIFRRERMVNLRLDAYVLSKFPLLALLTAGQCAVMLGIVWLFRGREGNAPVQLAALALAAWNGTALGLIISALAANADKAMAVVPLGLMPQIVLAGALVALPDMNPPIRAASQVLASRWANQALEIALLEGRTIDPELLALQAYAIPLWNVNPSYDMSREEGRVRFLRENAGAKVEETRRLALDLGVLGAMVALQLGAVAVILRRQDVF